MILVKCSPSGPIANLEHRQSVFEKQEIHQTVRKLEELGSQDEEHGGDLRYQPPVQARYLQTGRICMELGNYYNISLAFMLPRKKQKEEKGFLRWIVIRLSC